VKLGMKKCDKSTSSQQEQFEIWMDSIEAISDLIIEAREEIDNDRFLENYAEKAIMGWKGLKVKHMPALMPVDISGIDGEDNIEYSSEDAIELLKNSTVFDQFVTDTMNDFEQFSKKKAETDAKN